MKELCERLEHETNTISVDIVNRIAWKWFDLFVLQNIFIPQPFPEVTLEKFGG